MVLRKIPGVVLNVIMLMYAGAGHVWTGVGKMKFKTNDQI